MNEYRVTLIIRYTRPGLLGLKVEEQIKVLTITAANEFLARRVALESIWHAGATVKRFVKVRAIRTDRRTP